MKGQVASSNHTLVIDEYQIDVWYNFLSLWMQIFVDGKLVIEGSFSPTAKSFNYVNILDVGITALNFYKNRMDRKANENYIIRKD